jgi:NADH dehydrogenase
MNIPESNLKRVVIVGAGFGGLQIATNLNRNLFQIVLIDKNNYHTFQPLLYQIATAEIEPDSIIHEVRSLIRNKKNFYFRLANIIRIDSKEGKIYSNIGSIYYDYLVIATGSHTNYFGNSNFEQYAASMKTISEAIYIRSMIFNNIESALLTNDLRKRDSLITFVIVGGGPTGVELSGALSDLKDDVFPYEYPELDISRMSIYLIQSTYRLLDGMSESSADTALKNLKDRGVNVLLNTLVKDYDGREVLMNDGRKISSMNFIWAAGVKGALIEGFISDSIDRFRLKVDEYNRVKNYENIFAVGDIASMKTDTRFPRGHPMVAQVAIQQGLNLAKNLNNLVNSNKIMKGFKYLDRGSMATIVRNKAVCDLPLLNFKGKGFFAWFLWMGIHLLYLVGFRNRLIVLFNWIIQYFQRNKNLRIIY